MSESVDQITLKKMQFIYNALQNGWTIKYSGEDEYEFVKPTKSLKKKFTSLKDFIDKNIK